MTRSLSSPVSTAVDAHVTKPGYLVRISFAMPLRISSRGEIAWMSQTWAAWDIRVNGLAIDGGASSQNGQLILGNADYTIGALVLNEGIADRAIDIWAIYGETPAEADPVQIFSGVGDDAVIDPNKGEVTIGLQQQGGVTLYCPRAYINRASGFSFIPPDGTLIQWNGETFRLASEK